MTNIAKATAAIQAEIDAQNAKADAARPEFEPNRWPERDAADAVIAPLNRALANLSDV